VETYVVRNGDLIVAADRLYTESVAHRPPTEALY